MPGTKQTKARVVFDARDIAGDVYEHAKDRRDYDDLAAAWVRHMDVAYGRVPTLKPLMNQLQFKTTFPGTHGYFLGPKEDGEIAIAGASIVDHGGSILLMPNTAHFASLEPHRVQYLATGFSDIVQEFGDGGRTTRARKVVAEDKWYDITPEADAQARRISDIVAAVRDWSGSKLIGGDIATIILERGKGWRWFHRPDFCPQK